MRRSLKFLVGATALAAAFPAVAQTSATASATGTATVVAPITLSKTTDLAFGSMMRPNTGSNTVTIDQASGNRAISGGGDGALVASTSSPALYSVAGEGGAAFSITVPTSFTLTRSGGTETLPVSLLAPGTPSGSLNGSAGSNGNATFTVGGTLPLSATTVAGSYSGTFDVTVGYN